MFDMQSLTLDRRVSLLASAVEWEKLNADFEFPHNYTPKVINSEYLLWYVSEPTLINLAAEHVDIEYAAGLK